MRRLAIVLALVALGAGSASGHGGNAAHNRLDEALKRLNEVLAEEPDNLGALSRRGHLLLTELNEWEEGLQDFQHLIDLRAAGANVGPRTYEAARTCRAIGRYRLGDWKAAYAELDEICTSGSENPAAWFFRAELRHALGDHKGAKTDLDRALTLHRWPLAYVHRAEAQAALGDDAAARADYAEALKLDPRHVTCLCSRALFELARGGVAAATSDAADAAVAVQPEVSPVVEATRARLHAARGFKLEARGFANTAIGLWQAEAQVTRSPSYRAGLLLQIAKVTSDVQGAAAALPIVEQALTVVPWRPDLHRERVQLLAAVEGTKPEDLEAARRKLAEVEEARIPRLAGVAPVGSR